MRRYEEILVELEREVRSRTVGSRLPAFRNLMARFGSSQATVDRALKSLEANGYIIRRRGSGLYIGEAARSLQAIRTGTVVFVVHDVSNRAYSLLVRGGEEAAREKDLRVIVQSFAERFPEPGGEFPADVKGLVLVPRSAEIDNGSAARFLAGVPKEIARAIVENEIPGQTCPFVGMDDFGAGRSAGEIFKKRGVRRVACLSSSLSRVAQTRLSGFVEAFGRAPEVVIDFPAAENLDREALRKLPKSGVQGLFISRPDITLQTLCFLEALQVRVPQDLFTVSIAEEEDEKAYPFRVSTIVKPTTQVGRDAVLALGSEPAISVRLPYRVSEAAESLIARP